MKERIDEIMKGCKNARMIRWKDGRLKGWKNERMKG